jgi:tRNA (cytidine/uridine-2'-O-)-methyltransferase
VRPLGFVLSDRQIRRSAMDYWDRLQLTVHDDEDAFRAAAEAAGGRLWLFTSKATKSHWDADFRDGDWLIYGSETHGLTRAWLDRYPEQAVRIPQVPEERCLNLATAAGIGLYEALRKATAPPRTPPA